MALYQHGMVFFSMKTGVLNLSYQNALPFRSQASCNQPYRRLRNKGGALVFLSVFNDSSLKLKHLKK